jgi:hypothetical protein
MQLTFKWFKYSANNLPPQGLKILCFRKGDVWVARRMHYNGKDYFLEIPFGGELGAIDTGIPDYWMLLELPEGCTGYMKIAIDGGDIQTFDELQRTDPKFHEKFVRMMVNSIIQPKKKKK